MKQEDNYIRLPVLKEAAEKLKQRKRVVEVERGKDISWTEFLLEATKGVKV